MEVNGAFPIAILIYGRVYPLLSQYYPIIPPLSSLLNHMNIKPFQTQKHNACNPQ
jgi:hypothetical protein